MSDLIQVAREGAIATVSLNRAVRRNAITNAMMEELIAIATAFSDDEETRAVIFRGEGGDFSVGIDLQSRGQGGGARASLLRRRRDTELGAKLMRALIEIPQPTVCAIQGVATGGGACIAAACDFRIAAADARIGYGEVKLGMNLMWNALPLCVHLVGPARAKQMVMTGKLERWGFVDSVVAGGALMDAARTWAAEYAALPPIAVQMIKRSINQLAGPLDHAIMHMDADQYLLATGTDDFREAVAAFFEKRKATFKGD
jgi:enoyl-CoA hydratase/carnithine racemase